MRQKCKTKKKKKKNLLHEWIVQQIAELVLLGTLRKYELDEIQNLFIFICERCGFQLTNTLCILFG